MSSIERELAEHSFDVFEHGGEMGCLIRSHDWSETSLGPIEQWSQVLSSIVSVMLASSFPIILYWGEDLTILYNDSYISLIGTKHPRILGKLARETWNEMWHILEPMFKEVLVNNKATWSYDRCIFVSRNNYLEEIYCIWSFTPIRDESGKVCGVLAPCTETTKRVLNERRLSTLRLLANKIVNVTTVSEACDVTADALIQNRRDIPFLLIYLFEDNSEDREKLILSKSYGFSTEDPFICPQHVVLTNPKQTTIWPLKKVFAENSIIIVSDSGDKNIKLPGGNWPEPTKEAILIPICISTQNYAKGVFIMGVNSRRELDIDYRAFFELIVSQFAKGLATILAYQAEKRRSEYLDEMNRTKTIFFNNISHELRTPITLMLGQLQRLMANEESTLSYSQLEQINSLNRNVLLLLKHVNRLLDFSKIEANRMQASFEQVNLTELTYDFASQFRSLLENAELEFNVECKPFTKKVYVDVEMWEKIIQNLLINAFKYTFSGVINVELKQKLNFAVLTVSDTGIGIPEKEIPYIFDRFYRIAGHHGRTHEGSGIGLALVSEVVRQHGGKIAAKSIYGQGSRFIVIIPLGLNHLPIHQIKTSDNFKNSNSSALYIN